MNLNSALSKRTPKSDLEIEQDKNKPPQEDKKLTIKCLRCNSGVWIISARKLRQGQVIDRSDLKLAPNKYSDQINNLSYVTLDCPYCGEIVFYPSTYGGFFCFTVERNDVPSRSLPGVRFYDPGMFYPNDDLAGYRSSIHELPALETRDEEPGPPQQAMLALLPDVSATSTGGEG